MRGRVIDGAESELASAAGVDGIPFELWEKPIEQRDITPAGATVGVNLDPIRPAVFRAVRHRNAGRRYAHGGQRQLLHRDHIHQCLPRRLWRRAVLRPRRRAR